MEKFFGGIGKDTIRAKILDNGDVSFFHCTNRPDLFNYLFTLTVDELSDILESAESIQFENNLKEYEEVAERKEA